MPARMLQNGLRRRNLMTFAIEIAAVVTMVIIPLLACIVYTIKVVCELWSDHLWE
jgi:hypothetical protein